MSLFRLCEWYSANLPNTSCFAVGPLLKGIDVGPIGNRDVCVIGGEDGILTVLDPGGVEKTVDSQLLQMPTGQPVVQLIIGSFFTGDGYQLAVLGTKNLSFYALSYDQTDPSKTLLKVLTQHELPEASFNMCMLNTGNGIMQILAQTLSCRLALYQGDQCLFSRAPLPALHPGPLAYHPGSQSLIIASGSAVNSIKFSHLYGLGTAGKKVTFDWSYSLGDWPLEVGIVEAKGGLQPCVLVLCRRVLNCLTSGGNLRWQVRLECVATAMITYHHDDSSFVRCIVATNTNTLLVFADNQLIWNCHCDHMPVAIKIASFNPVFQLILSILTNDGHVIMGYLGTEPNLFKFSHDNRVVDFQAKIEELRQIEGTLKNPNAAIEKSTEFTISYAVEDFERPQATGSRAEPPACRIRLKFEGADYDDKMVVNASSALQNRVSEVSPSGALLTVQIGKDLPISNRVNVIAHCPSSQSTASCEIRVPLSVCFLETSPERNAKYKIIIESDSTVVPMNELFSDYSIENPSSLGLLVYGTDATVSIFTASKSNRYRIQSDRQELLFIIVDEIAERLKQHRGGVVLSAHLPLEYIITHVERYMELEVEIQKLKTEVESRSRELRAVQSLLLTKAKSSKPESVEHIDLLYDSSHKALSSLFDKLLNCENDARITSLILQSLFDLSALISKISNSESTLDGQFFRNTQQALKERLAWAAGMEMDPGRMIEYLCRHTAKNLPEITEEDEDEPDEHEKLAPDHVPI